jgi:VWFA-related protein
VVLTIVAALASLVAPFAQEPPPQQPPTFRSGTTAVLLDVVVRDRRGRPVRDVKQGELTVLENGSPREIRSFRLVERTAAGERTAPAAGAESVPDALRYPTLVTFVFDHLSQNARSLARRAALQFVARDLPADHWVAVFGLEQRLHLEQPFTRDTNAVKTAIGRATALATDPKDRLASEQIDRDAAQRSVDAAMTTLTGQRPTANVAAIGAAVSEVQVQEVMSRMTRMIENADMQQRGQSTLYPLMALMKAQGALTGRKALLLFSEGVPIPPNLEEAYRSVISEANKANVSIYTIDARGLDAARSLDASRQMLAHSASNSLSQLVAGASQRPVTMDDVMNSEVAEGALRSDVQDALRVVADETGGALIANTNDLGSILVERVRSDLDSYYEVGYVPAPAPPDGRFRSVEVKIDRRGLAVHSRSGYFSLPDTDTTPLLPYELPMLAAAAATPPPRSFDYGAATFRFDQSPTAVKHTLVLEVPLEHLSFQENRRKGTYSLRFTAMALIKDQAGEVLQRFSESYPLEGPVDRVQALKRGRLRFMRQFTVPPGRYTLVTVARDQATERSSVWSTPLDVVDPGKGLRVSDLAIIRSVDQTAAADAVEDPFRTAGMRVVPNVDRPISKAANDQISAYLTIYPDRGGAVPSLTFEFVRDGAVVGRSAAELPEADENGRIKFVASFPTSMFTPGIYDLRAVATQGDSRVSSQARFTLIP